MGTPLPLPKKGAEPSNFWPIFIVDKFVSDMAIFVLKRDVKLQLTNYCQQTAGWIKMALGMEEGLSPGDFVLDGDPASPPLKGHSPPIFGQCLLWPNGWMD